MSAVSTRLAALLLSLMAMGCNGTSTAASPPAGAPTAPASTSAPKETRMTQTHRLLEVDDAFFAEDAHARAGAGRDELLEDGFTGVAIDAPFVLDTSARDSLPVLGVFARRAAEPADFMRDAMLVTVDLDGPGFVSVPALQSEKGGDGGSPGGGSGVVAEGFGFDARTRIASLPWGPGRVRIYVVHRAELSNGVVVTLHEGDPVGRLAVPVSVVSESGSTVEAGEQPVALRGPQRATTEPGATALLKGSVRGEGGEAVVHLLAVGDAPSPFAATVRVSLTDGVGTFAVNLLGDNPLPKAPGTWHLYAFSGEHVSGPVTIELTPGATPW